MKKINVAVIFGGTNTEHEVSLVSAQGIISNLDREKYNVLPIKITKENVWVTPKQLEDNYTTVIPEKIVEAKDTLESVGGLMQSHVVDVIFPVLHGPYGEDGTIQGMLELMRLPYVGCNVLSSAMCMDKVVQKQLCEAAAIPVPKYVWFRNHDWQTKRAELIQEIEALTYPVFVKPANQGSSVGITKAHNQEELIQGIKESLTRDLKVTVEQAVEHVREIECSVLGNRDPQASVLGEIIPGNEFYDFNAKYIDNNSQAIIPAKLPTELSQAIKDSAIKAFKVMNCSGLARVDFLLNDQTQEWYLSEINTMPGFTPISMYPKLWEASGVSYTELLDRLIELALEKHTEKSNLNYSR